MKAFADSIFDEKKIVSCPHENRKTKNKQNI